MNALFREQEIAFLRYRNRLLAGVCLSIERGKARFATSARETVNVPLENVLLATGAMAEDPGEAGAWWERAEAAGAEMDLEEVWDLVRDEGENWQAADLADLYFDGEVAPDRLAALLVHLETSLYFASSGRDYRPLTEAEVGERVRGQERAEAREQERALFQQWFLEGEEAEGASDYLPGWVDRLKDYVLYGESSAHVRWVERMSDGQADRRRAFGRLVDMGVWEADEHLELIVEKIPVEFPRATVDAAGALALDPLLEDGRRRDLTGLSVFTIDDASTTDMDDGVSVDLREDGTVCVGVHITDVAALVPIGSDLDREAAGRVSSLYFPDRKIPMLPGRISEDLGSLRPGAPRLALSLLFDVAPNGSVADVEIVPSVIRCREKLAYEQVDAALEDASHPLYGAMSALYRTAEAQWIARLQMGAVAVDRPECQIRVTPEKEVEISVRERNSRANLLVSELMVMANVAVAGFCRERDIPIVYRTQQAPDLSDLEEVENEVLRRHRTLRRMRPAEMTLEPGLHGGLGVEPYCQASSPLRRYPDLAVQRQIAAFLLGEALPYDLEGIREVSYQADERIREVGRMERRRNRYWFLKYLQGFAGREFDAVVLEAQERRLYVEVLEYGFQTDVRPSRPAEPGETILLRLGRSDPWEDTISFTQVG